MKIVTKLIRATGFANYNSMPDEQLEIEACHLKLDRCWSPITGKIVRTVVIEKLYQADRSKRYKIVDGLALASGFVVIFKLLVEIMLN